MSLTEQAEQLAAQAAAAFDGAGTEAELFQIKSRYLGKKGELAALLKEIPKLEPSERSTTGAGINRAKKSAEASFEARLAALKDAALASTAVGLDPTAPARRRWRGHLHPVMLAWQEIADIFVSMGYSIHEGPQVDTDWHTFEALNIPPGHPARPPWWAATSTRPRSASPSSAMRSASGAPWPCLLYTSPSPRD